MEAVNDHEGFTFLFFTISEKLILRTLNLTELAGPLYLFSGSSAMLPVRFETNSII